MPPLTAKLGQHFNEQDPSRHPGQLLWPGVQGLPVIANDPDDVAMLTERELQNFVKVNKYKAKWFDLSNAQDLAEYTDVMEHILAKWYVLRKQTWHEDVTGSEPRMRTWVEWIQQYAAPSPRATARNIPHGHR